MADQPAIAILPYGRKLTGAAARITLDELVWPLGRPDRLAGGGTLGDLTPRDHLVVFPRTDIHLRRWPGIRARISVVLGEPAVVHRRHHWLLRLSHTRFHRILTFDQRLIERLPNAVFFPLGSTWVPDWETRDLTKTAECSLIASAKRHTQGQKLRHEIVARARAAGIDIAVMGGGYRPFADKADGLAPFRYSVVIENASEPNYFSEKLVDAVLCETVPIYWGCPNLDRFFDMRGIIHCADADAILAALGRIGPEDYARRLPHLRAIKPDVAAYAPLERRMAEAIRDTL